MGFTKSMSAVGNVCVSFDELQWMCNHFFPHWGICMFEIKVIKVKIKECASLYLLHLLCI